MPLKHTMVENNADLRARVFEALNIENIEGFIKVNNCRYGIILKDLDGHDRYVQVNIKATKYDEGCTAQEQMEEEMGAYADQLAREAKRKEEKAKKVEEAKKKREKEKEEEA
jgi:hypothetical protein